MAERHTRGHNVGWVDLMRGAGLGTTAVAAARNGLPDVAPYTWRPGEAQREAELQDRLAWIRRVAEQRAAARMAHGPTCGCPLCIEQYGPIKPPPPDREARHG